MYSLKYAAPFLTHRVSSILIPLLCYGPSSQPYLSVMSYRTSIDGAVAIPEVFDLIVPPRDGRLPAAVTPGQVLTDTDAQTYPNVQNHDDVIKWKHFPRYWPIVRGIHRPPVNSPHKGQWRGALMFSLIWAGMDGWVNNRKAGDLRRQHTHYDVTVMLHELLPFNTRPS